MISSFGNILAKLIDTKIKPLNMCDQAERQYQKMIREEEEKLKGFDPQTDRKDLFYHSLLSGHDEYKYLWGLIQVILIMSHGQAQVKRGFSVNEDFLTPQLKKETLVGLRTVCDTESDQH